MDRKDVFISIVNRYNQSIISPVNPFTVDNPDALVFNGHTLSGLFMPLAHAGAVRNSSIATGSKIYYAYYAS